MRLPWEQKENDCVSVKLNDGLNVLTSPTELLLSHSYWPSADVFLVSPNTMRVYVCVSHM